MDDMALIKELELEIEVVLTYGDGEIYMKMAALPDIKILSLVDGHWINPHRITFNEGNRQYFAINITQSKYNLIYYKDYTIVVSYDSYDDAKYEVYMGKIDVNSVN